MHQEEASRFELNKETKQSIVKNKEIASTDESVKDGNMAGVQNIEYIHECASISNSVWSINLRKNAEVDIELNLVKMVVCNMRG